MLNLVFRGGQPQLFLRHLKMEMKYMASYEVKYSYDNHYNANGQNCYTETIGIDPVTHKFVAENDSEAMKVAKEHMDEVKLYTANFKKIKLVSLIEYRQVTGK